MYFIYIYCTINIVPYTSVRFRLRCTTCMHKYNLKLRFFIFLMYFLNKKKRKDLRFQINIYLFFKVFIMGFKKIDEYYMDLCNTHRHMKKEQSICIYVRDKETQQQTHSKKWFCIS